MIENKNMSIWNAVCETDPKYTSKVNTRGGFTAVDAYYQIKQATELWGPYGSNWKLADIEYAYNIENLCIIKANFIYPSGSFQIGNSISIQIMKKSKLELDEEFIKKIETNTISKALSRLGFAADVFVGKFDDARYIAEMNEKYGNPEPAKAAPPAGMNIPRPGASAPASPQIKIPSPVSSGGVPPIPKPR